ncbi:MAG: hypothetical protein J5623_00640 [Clostridiales bacterium]|nr:hypothetical protein [Clostridiales bacterium]
MNVYIAYRNLNQHFCQNNACGGIPVNNDYRFTPVKDGIYYLLTRGNDNYAVSKEDGKKFIEDVMGKCTGEHPGFFPLVPSLNGKDAAAVIEITREVEMNGFTRKQPFYCDMDDGVLLSMLEDLRAKSGAPMDERALMNYLYPNAVLPEGDFNLDYVYHGIYCKEEPRPAATIQTFFPDKRTSRLWMTKEGLYVEIREDDSEKTYKVPGELIPEIKEKVRELCKEPAEAFVEHGDWEGYVRFDKDKKRIFTDPDKTLALLKEIASKSEFESSQEVDKRKYYLVGKNAPGNGFIGLGMMGFAMNPATAAPAPVPSNGPKCRFCGADVTGKKFCSECGGEVGK